MKLYASLTSPYARKVRVLILEKQLPVELVEVVTGSPESPVPRLNPLGKIPVLERDDGSCLYDSPVIVEYLDSLGAPALIPASGEPRWQALRWHALADGIVDAVIARMMELRRAPEHQSREAVVKQQEKVARALAYTDAHALGDNGLVDGVFSIADIAMATALEYVDFRYPHAWRETYPRAARWLDAVSARASFRATRPPR